ncbi:MAG TPA: sugar ABC transporter permease [candidate division Zixibacteria bacterium]|nr:sugar ABC transporter permease [candidate division Zixibacteria bacterium]
MQAAEPRRILRLPVGQDRSTLLWVALFLSPWIIGFVVFTAGPMLWSLWLSFTNYDVLTGTGDFIGLRNYERMLGDRRVGVSLWNTAYFTLLYVPLSVGLGLLLASLLNRTGGRLAGFFRTAFYLPNVTPAVAVGTLFLLLLNNPDGLVNQALAAIGIPGPSWLNDPAWIKNGIVLMMLWSIGGTVVILFAALRNVPVELYEAARIDGASAWRQFRHVTLPMISGALFFVLIINTVASLQLFSEVYTIFYGQQQGQTAGGDSALFYVVYLFRNAFEFFEMGYASALAWLLFAVIGLITFVQFRVSRRFVYYEGEER